MEAYGDQSVAASNQFCCKSREELSKKHVIASKEWYNGNVRQILSIFHVLT